MNQIPLSIDEVRTILSICSPAGLLVGGQALAFWADHLGVDRPRLLAPYVTADADFIGDASLARDLGKRLGWKTWIPTLDDATPQTGKVTHREKDGVKEVDFLSGVAGLSTKDIARRAAVIKVPGIGTLRVIHPVDVLDSRIQNLHLLPEKRNEMGIAQAELSIDVARAWVRREIEEDGERAGLKLLERIVDIAAEIAGLHVAVLYGLDPLRAVPISEFRTTTALHKKRWPQIEKAIDEKRRKLGATMKRAR